MKNSNLPYLILVLLMTFLASCSKDGDLNLFTKSQDVKFGEQLDSLVNADYNVLPRTANNAAAYAYLDNMLQSVLSSDEILYGDYFPWKLTIIDEDVLNAFAAPGGYLYFYTGLMKYLDNGAQLAGVLAHEIAHADRRHSTENMTKVYGFNILLGVLLGNNNNKLVQIAAELAAGSANLAFSRKHEYEADEYAVRYTSATLFHPKGVSGFFEKLESESANRPPEFLSTHPSPDNRLEAIDEVWMGMGSPNGSWEETAYNNFLSALP